MIPPTFAARCFLTPVLLATCSWTPSRSCPIYAAWDFVITMAMDVSEMERWQNGEAMAGHWPSIVKLLGNGSRHQILCF